MVKKDQTRDTAASIEIELLRICHTSTDLKNLTRELITIFKRYSGCEAVGLRLHRGDDFPYFEVRGFADEFVEAERYLCASNADGELLVDSAGNPVLECMCGNIIRGRFDPSKPFFTKHGSFWTNSTTRLLANTSEADRQARTRNRCNGEGYESVALIPVKAHGKTLGLIQFNDYKADIFTLKRIEVLERLVDYSALAISDLEAANALQESEKRYRRMVESSTEGIWVMNADHLTTFVNTQMVDMLGYTVEEMIGKPVEGFFFSEDLPHHEVLMAEREKGADDRYERRFRRKDGSTLWTIVSPKPILDDAGVFQGSFAMFTDVTTRKRMEEIQNSRMHLIRFAEHHTLDELLQEGLDQIEELTGSKISFCHFLEDDQNTLTLQAWSSQTTSTFCKAEGKSSHYPVDQAGVWVDCIYEHRAVIHNDYASLPHRKGMPDDHARVDRELVVPVFRGDKITAIFGVGNKPQDYNLKDVSIVSLFAEMVWDIAERKISDTKLKGSENRYLRLTDNAADIIFHYDIIPEMKLTYINPAVERITGYTPEECYADPHLMLNLIHPDDKPRMDEFVQSLSIPDEPLVMRWVGKDGTIRWMESRITPILDQEQKLAALEGITRDVTSNKLFEETYKKYDQILASTRDGIALLDRNYRYVAVNPAYEVFSGIKREEIIGLTVADYLGEKVFNNLVKVQFDRCLNGETIEYEAVVNYPVLGERWVRVTYYPYFDLNHEITGVVSNTRDITAHRMAEIKEQKSEDEYRNLLESSPNGVFVVQDGFYKYANQKGMKMLHCSAEQVNGLSAVEIVHPDDRAAIIERIRRAESGSANEPMRVRIIRPDGTILYSESSSVPIDFNGKPATLIVSRDVSSQIEVEISLEETRQLQNVLLDNIKLGIVLVAADGNIIQGNHEFFQMMGYQEEDLPGISVASITAPESREKTGIAIQRLISGQDPVLVMEKVYLRKDGTRFIAATNATAVRDENGNVKYLTAFFLDITEQKQAEKQVRESESRFRSFVESANDIVYSLSPEGIFTYVSPNWKDLLGYETAESLGTPFEDHVHPEDRHQCWDFLQGVIETGQKNSGVEYRLKHKNGEWRWITSNGSPLFDISGKVIAYLGIARDTTEGKLASDALELEKNILLQSQEMANLGSFVWDLRDDSLTWSRNMFVLHGLDPDVSVRNLSDVSRRLIHPEDFPRVQDEIQKMVAARQVWAMQFRVVRPDHRIRIIQSSGEFEYDSCGNPVRCIGIHQDITERKESEDSLWKSEERFRIIASNTPDHIIMQDKDLRYTFVLNPQLGLTEEDMIGKTDHDFLSKDEAERLNKAKTQVLGTGQPLEFETSLVSRSGILEYFSGTFVPSFKADGKVDGLIGYFRNITDIKLTEEALKTSETLLAKSQEIALVGSWELDVKTSRLTWSDEAYRIFGMSPQEMAITYNAFMDMLHPNDRKMVDEAYARSVQEGKDYYEIEHRLVHKHTGDIRTVFEKCVHIRDMSGNVVKSIGMVQDITERKQAEEALITEKKRLENIITGTNSGTWELNLQTGTTVINDRWAEMLGYTLEELAPTTYETWTNLVHPDDLEMAQEAEEKHFDGKSEFYEVEIRMHHKDGHWVWVLTTGKLISRDKSGKPFLVYGTHQDITERKTIDQKIRESSEQFHTLISTSLDGFFINDKNGAILEANPAYCQMIGYCREEVLQMKVSDIDVQETQEMTEAHIRAVMENYSDRFETKHQCKDGHIIDVDIISTFVPSRNSFMVFIRDITERKNAEEGLKESEARFRNMADTAPVLIWMSGVDKLCQYFNQPWLTFTGRTLEEEKGNGWQESVHPDDLEYVLKVYTTAFDSQAEYSLEYRLLTAAGIYHWIMDKGVPRYTPDGTFVGYIGSAFDINERKLAEYQLKKQERILEETQKIARVGSFELDFVNNTRYWSNETFRILAADETKPPPPAVDGYLDLIHPDDELVAYSALHECRQTGKKIDLTYRIITGHRELRYIHELGEPLFDNAGVVVKITGSIQDITERKLAEDDLRKHEHLLEESQKTANVGSYIIDLETGENFWTRETYHIFGIDENLPVPSVQEYQNLVHPEDIPLLYEHFDKSITNGEKFDFVYRIVNISGETRYVHSIGFPEKNSLGNVKRLVGTFQDVTIMKFAEHELIKKQNLLEESQRIARLGSFVIDLEHKTRAWSRETYRILGMDEDGPAPQMGGFEAMIHPDDAKMEEDAFRDCTQSGRPIDLTYRIITIDGETRFVHELGRPEFDPEGKVIRIVGTLQDVTESRKLEKKLKESELRFRSIYENIPIGYQSLNPDGYFLDVNPAWSVILGYEREEVLGKWFGDFLVHEEVDLFKERFPMFKKIGKVNDVEFHFKHKDGHVLVGNFNGMIEHDAFGGVVRAHCNLEDITIRKQIEETLHASLAEKDVLLREVHHRVKNNLAAILGLLDMERQSTSDVHADSLLLDLSNRIKSMSTVHEKLYRAENLSRIDFQDYLKSFVSHLKTTFMEKENIVSRIEADGIELDLDLAVPCGLIVNELVTNSLKYAFPGGKPGSRKDKHCQIWIKMFREGNGYVLQVSDNGVGLPEEFNWQDTKSMGLRLVRMLGEHQLGGRIETDTAGGTAYTIHFEARLKEQDDV